MPHVTRAEQQKKLLESLSPVEDKTYDIVEDADGNQYYAVPVADIDGEKE